MEYHPTVLYISLSFTRIDHAVVKHRYVIYLMYDVCWTHDEGQQDHNTYLGVFSETALGLDPGVCPTTASRGFIRRGKGWCGYGCVPHATTRAHPRNYRNSSR